MAKKALMLLLLISLSTAASGWGDETQKHVCETVVSQVWGEETLGDCLRFDRKMQTELCNKLKETNGVEVYEKCMQETVKENHLHPALIPYLLFNDPEEHVDYGVCPVKGPANQQLMCGNSSIRPAVENSEMWFTRAVNADSLCDQVFFFCLGSNYYSDSRFKLNNVQNLKMCYSNVGEQVDAVITKEKWQFNAYCSFEGWVQRAGRKVRERHSQTFTLSSDDINQIIGNLTIKAASIASTPYPRELEPESAPANRTIEAGQTDVTTTTTVIITQPLNETQLFYEETMDQVMQLMEETFSMMEGMSGENTGMEYEKGRGSFLIKAFLILLVISGFGFGILIFIKIELKKLIKKPPAPKPPAYRPSITPEERPAARPSITPMDRRAARPSITPMDRPAAKPPASKPDSGNAEESRTLEPRLEENKE